jgi:hemin uptake protein HemP
MTPKQAAPSSEPAAMPPLRAVAPKRISSELLLGPSREMVIVHGGREYRLRVTQNGKLILTA